MKLNFRATLRSGRFIAAIAFAAFLTGNAGAAVVTTLAQDDAVVIPGDAATPSPAGDGAVTPEATPVPQNGDASPSDQPVVVDGGSVIDGGQVIQQGPIMGGGQAMGYPSSGGLINIVLYKDGGQAMGYPSSGCGCGQPAYQQSGCGCGSSNYMPMISGAPMAPSQSRRSRRPSCLQNLRSRPRCGGRCR